MLQRTSHLPMLNSGGHSGVVFPSHSIMERPIVLQWDVSEPHVTAKPATINIQRFTICGKAEAVRSSPSLDFEKCLDVCRKFEGRPVQVEIGTPTISRASRRIRCARRATQLIRCARASPTPPARIASSMYPQVMFAYIDTANSA